MPLPEPSSAANDVFISYAHEDRPLARQLAEALQARQLTVWWDRDLAAGAEFAREIESQLQQARVVIGLWSAESVRSTFVRDECSRALRAGKLVPVRIEEVELPLGFGQSHTLDLLDWNGDADDETFQQLAREVGQRKGMAAPSLSGPAGFGGFRWRRRAWFPAAMLLSAGLLAYGGWFTWDRMQQAETSRLNISEADRHFRAGLQYQFAKEPELVSALNEYLSTLELRPNHARAQYYLAHLYVQNGRPEDALRSFQNALAQTEAPLDTSLRAEARRQMAALSPVPNEARPVTRAKLPAAPVVAASSTDPAGEQAGFRARRPARPITAATPGGVQATRPASSASLASPGRTPPRLEPPPEQLAAVAERVNNMLTVTRTSAWPPPPV